MKKQRSTKRSLATSVLALICCFAMLLGSTFAWFTDSVSSKENKIIAGNLSVDLSHKVNDEWISLKKNPDHKIFDYDRWEPGYTRVETLRIDNLGSLALQYRLSIEEDPDTALLGSKGERLSDVIDVYLVDGERTEVGFHVIKSTWAYKGTLSEVLKDPAKFLSGELLPLGESLPANSPASTSVASKTLTLALHMREEAGNEYQGLKVGDLFVNLIATQLAYENDSFGDDYDKDALFPSLNISGITVDINTQNNVVTEEAKVSGTGVMATIPEGVVVQDGAKKLGLSVTEKTHSDANLTLDDGEALRSLDVHMDGVAENNTVPMLITVEQAMKVGLNIGNYTLYHVEDGVSHKMTAVGSLAELDAHNEFYYDPTTGNVTLAMATFSEVALVAEVDNAWKGEFDYSWYTSAVAPVDGEAVTEYVIANADQLAAFGAIVGGMDGQTQDSFSGKTVKLIADINLGDKESENNPDIIFYPIGYYNSEGTYERTNTAITSGLRIFEGTFDGNGHTVSNFYHNTWEMKGDHDWYSPTEQYYRDGMGLFGRVYKGKVMNLTVKNFSSDGEIATTGVIAAYADGAIFENIAIFNCNPRVYNIGNGGIVGCVGWYAKEANLKTTFKNVTVDNSNKISALWGSYDVACGGIVGQYYPTSGQSSAKYPVNAGIYFENCHISAQMDVYNDVCANYQYYAYRYTGMLIGSVRENETINGHVYPKMDGITASGCTVHFGTWNDYYYCEIIDNTTASYTHDYQMSRLTEIKAIDGTTITYLDDTTGTVPTSGRANYVIVDYTKGHGTENAPCYHFKDGKVWNHEDAGTEIVDGKEVLVEDKQHIYLEFNNLVTGYGWGVTTKGVGDLAGVTILDREVGNSVEKFEGKVTELANNKEYKLGDIFGFVDKGVELVPGALAVSVNNLDENNPVSATIVYDRKNWENGTITLAGTGDITITIQDYYFCTPTTITVNVTERESEEKFDVVMNNGDFLHRVGNVGTVALDKLFKAKDGVTVGTVSVTVEAIDGTGASGTYSNNAIQFNGTGVVKVTITDNDYCIPTELYLEVVDAVNATAATDAKDKDIVLLNNIGSGFTVDKGHTVYGNGFTLTYTGDGRYLNNGLKQGVVMVQNGGTLDNLRIKAPIYPTAFMYYGPTQMGDYVQQNTNPREVEGDKTRYYYQLSAVATYGNATISNCYIYGGRTNIYVNTGDVTIKDTILECGVVANVQIQSTAEYTVTLENVTTIQYQVNATIGDTSKVMLGAGVLVGPDTSSNPKIVLNGKFKQYNWVTQEDYDAVSESSKVAGMLIDGALDKKAYNHTINGKTASNLGIIYMNEADVAVTNNTDLPYKLGTVSISSANGQVYSLQNASAEQIYSDYKNADRNTVNGDYLPTFDFNLGDQEISYDGSEDTRYLYGDKNGITALYQEGDNPITLDLTKLATIYKYTGINYPATVSCKDANGKTLEATNGVVTLSAQGKYTLVFTVTDNIFYKKDGSAIDKSVERTFSVPLNLTVKEASIKNAVVNITNTALEGVYTLSGVDDYKLRINFLDAISVTDYDNKGNGAIVSLNTNIESVTLTPASVNVFSTASTITVTYKDGRVLTVNLSKISGSSPGTKTAKVNTSGGLYFITEGALNNKPTEASNQNKCTITSVSFKGNSGSTVTNDTDVTVTWALGSSSSGGGGCVTPDTLITLADGTQVRVDSLTGNEELLVWNMETGKLDKAPMMFLDSDPLAEHEIIKLYFSDGTEVKVIYEHGFWDYDLNKYVYLDANAADYIGHTFAKQNGDLLEKVQLVDVVIEKELTTAWSPVTVGHLCYFVNGMLSMPGGVGGLFNIFEVDPETLTYDYEQMEQDIAQYGLYTYEELNALCPLSEDMFNAAGGAYLKISIGKGNLTEEELIAMITRYSKFFE